MNPWLKRLLIVVGSLVVLLVAVTLWGALLPPTHSLTRSALYRQPPDLVWRAIATFPAQPSWRPDVGSVERLADRNGHEVWKEADRRGGGVAFETLESVYPRRLVRRIVDEGLPFGGTWTQVLTPEGSGTRLSITEDGVVRNPFFRFVVRVVFGYARTADLYLKNLGTRFGEETTPQ